MKEIGVCIVGVFVGLLSLIAVSFAKDEPFAESVIIPIEQSFFCDSGEMMSPFLEVDTQAMVNQLSGDDFEKAQSLLNDLKRYDQNNESEISVEDEATLFVLEGRLADLLAANLKDGKVNCVTRDLLSKLSDQDKFQALFLWHEIQKSMLSESTIDNEEIDAKFAELDMLLSIAES